MFYEYNYFTGKKTNKIKKLINKLKYKFSKCRKCHRSKYTHWINQSEWCVNSNRYLVGLNWKCNRYIKQPTQDAERG